MSLFKLRVDDQHDNEALNGWVYDEELQMCTLLVQDSTISADDVLYTVQIQPLAGANVGQHLR